MISWGFIFLFFFNKYWWWGLEKRMGSKICRNRKIILKKGFSRWRRYQIWSRLKIINVAFKVYQHDFYNMHALMKSLMEPITYCNNHETFLLSFSCKTVEHVTHTFFFFLQFLFLYDIVVRRECFLSLVSALKQN